MPLAPAELQKMLDSAEKKPSIDLEWCRVGDEGIELLAKHLESSATLTNLDLAWNAISFKGATCLANSIAQSPQLTRLNLQGNPVGDTGAEYLAQLLQKDQTLTALGVESCHIGPQGFSRIISTLQVNVGLTSLNISRNTAGNNNPAILVSSSLKKNNTLTSLDIGGNGLSEGDFFWIADAIGSAFQQLRIGSTTQKAEAAVAAVLERRRPYCGHIMQTGVLTERNSMFICGAEEGVGDMYEEVSTHSPTAGLSVGKSQVPARRRRSFGERAIKLAGGARMAKVITGKQGEAQTTEDTACVCVFRPALIFVDLFLGAPPQCFCPFVIAPSGNNLARRSTRFERAAPPVRHRTERRG
jgi:hypothetical protein